MPCYDGRETQDLQNRNRRYSAMTALLCGVLRKDSEAITLAQSWLVWHETADEKRQRVQWDWQDDQIDTALKNCDQVLDESYKRLCVGAEESACNIPLLRKEVS